jgi:hypothetical protein
VEARRSRDIQRSLLQAVARSRLVALVAHNWAVAEDKMAVVEERRRCIVAGPVEAVALLQDPQSKDLLASTVMRCRQIQGFVERWESRRLRWQVPVD